MAVFGSLLFVVGCGKKEEPRPAVEQSSETSPTPASSGPAAGTKVVYLNGRSVMQNWMNHWGWEGEGTHDKNGYTFDYRELGFSELEDLSGSFAQNTQGLPADSVVFFKFCFADFSGDNLARLEAIIDKVAQTAGERGFKLIVGNTLPVRKQEGSPQMLKEYTAYNAWLQNKADTSGFTVFDEYSVLAGPDGFLNPSYPTEDSHPNGAAYDALDVKFFALLNNVFSK